MVSLPNQAHRLVLSWKPRLVYQQVLEGIVRFLACPQYEKWKRSPSGHEEEGSLLEIAACHVRETDAKAMSPELLAQVKPGIAVTLWMALHGSFRYKKGKSPWKILLVQDHQNNRTDMSWTWHCSLGSEHEIKSLLLTMIQTDSDTTTTTTISKGLCLPGLALVPMESKKGLGSNYAVEWGQSLFWDKLVPWLSAPQQLWSQWVARKVPLCESKLGLEIPCLGLTRAFGLDWILMTAHQTASQAHDVILGSILATLFDLQPEKLEISISLRVKEPVWVVIMCNRAPGSRGVPWPYLVNRACKEVLEQRHSSHLEQLGHMARSFHSFMSWTHPEFAQVLEKWACPGAHMSYGSLDLGSKQVLYWNDSNLLEAYYVPPPPFPDQNRGISFGVCAYMSSVRLAWISFEHLPSLYEMLQAKLTTMIHSPFDIMSTLNTGGLRKNP